LLGRERLNWRADKIAAFGGRDGVLMRKEKGERRERYMPAVRRVRKYKKAESRKAESRK
jgi:hypothetical protein